MVITKRWKVLVVRGTGVTPTVGAPPTTPAAHAIPTGWPTATIPPSPTAWLLRTVLINRITRRAATAWCAIRLATRGTRAVVAVNDRHCRLLLLYPGTNDLSELLLLGWLHCRVDYVRGVDVDATGDRGRRHTRLFRDDGSFLIFLV